MKQKRRLTGAVSVILAAAMVSTTAFAASVEFSDVPSDHWAYASISEMADKGIMSGIGSNQFAPSGTLTGAEFVTMIVRRFYEDKLGDGGEKWYSAFMSAAEREGILAGTSITAEGVISRYDMARLMHNVLKAQSVPITQRSVTSEIDDWLAIPNNYKYAVHICYNMGLLSGTDSKGTFNGSGSMDRAQAAVVMDRLLDVCENAPSAPEIPETPAAPTTITALIPGEVGGPGAVEVEGGFFFDSTRAATEPSHLTFPVTGYKKATFTVKAIDNDVQVMVGHSLEGRGLADPNVPEPIVVVPAGQSKTFTVDCSADESVCVWLGDGEFVGPWPGEFNFLFVECYLLDITLS